jgi:hypothetical protein
LADAALAYDPMAFGRANAMVEMARALSQEATEAKMADDAKAKREQARKLYEDAGKLVADVKDEIQKDLERLVPVLPAGDPRIAIRDQMRADYLQARLVSGAIFEESADLYEGDARNAKLEAAESIYGDVFEAYRTRLAGLYARAFQGRCLAKLGKLGLALQAYDDLIELPDSPEQFRQLKSLVVPLAAEAHCDALRRNYTSAIHLCESFLAGGDAATPPDDKSLNVRLHLARAYKLRGDELLAGFDRPGAAEAYASSRRHAQDVAEREGKHQASAKELLAELEKSPRD